MSNISEISYSLVKKGLEATTLRNQVISNNISNFNTKNFKKSTVTFEETLNEAMNVNKLKTTEERHIKVGQEYGSISVVKDESGSMNANGNNVDADQEMANSAANALMYNALISSINGKFEKTSAVINSK